MSEVKNENAPAAKASTGVTENRFDNIMDSIVKLEETGVKFPADYSPDNAARSAWLQLQELKDRSGAPALQVCKPASVATAMLKMVTMGLNPIKKQCYFIVYGSDLQCQVSYQGNLMTAKRFGLADCPANLIMQGDEFQYEIGSDGRTKVVAHKQSFANLDKEIIGAYAVANMQDGTSDTTIMTIKDIEASWKQGATNGNSPAHKNFKGEMCKKTVINRACKSIINSSDDGALFQDDTRSTAEEYVDHKIETEANRQEVTFEEVDREGEGKEEPNF